MKLNKKYFLLFLVIWVSACNITKNYERPKTSMPADFRFSENTAKDTSILAVRDFFKNESLLALIQHALQQNNNMQIAVQNIASASAVFKKTKLNYFPEINAQLQANSNTASKNSLTGITAEQFTSSRTFHDYTASLGATWEVDIWGKIKREKEEALANLLQSESVRQAIQTRLVADVANSYYNLLMLDNQLVIAKRNKVLNSETLRIVQIQYKAGQATNLAIVQAQAQVEQTGLLIAQIEQDIALQENALSLLCGQYASSIKREANPEGELNTVNMDYDISLLTIRPDVWAAELGLRKANARIGIQQASMYPAISLSATLGLNSLKASNWFSVPASMFYNFAGGLAQPIFNRKRLKLQYEQAKIEYEKSVLVFRQTVLEAYSQVSDALIREQKLQEQFQYAQSREQLLEEGIQNAHILFKNGMASYLEIIAAESNYLQASLAKAQLNREQMAAKIELYRAIGGGWQ
jgi:NodT family efflux transporter outer membrane factor (OMF) lipoprotein